MSELPQQTKTYSQHPIIDSDRWRVYQHRPGDIVITTSYKAGTTWMQAIVANLLYQDGEFPAPVSMLSPWLDMRLPPLEAIAAGLEAQTGRRFIKTHLPLDGIPYYEGISYVFVGRDPRDVFMSLWNHHSGYTDETASQMSRGAEKEGKSFPTDQPNIRAFWDDWISKGYFDWENDGYPYWSHLHHAQTWWDYRHLPNIELFHYSDLLAQPETEIRRLASYLGVEIDDAQLPGILKRTSFNDMKQNFDKIMPGSEQIWKGGGATFMNKGTNGRWKELLTEDDLHRYREVVAATLSPDLAEWLENGGA